MRTWSGLYHIQEQCGIGATKATLARTLQSQWFQKLPLLYLTLFASRSSRFYLRLLNVKSFHSQLHISLHPEHLRIKCCRQWDLSDIVTTSPPCLPFLLSTTSFRSIKNPVAGSAFSFVFRFGVKAYNDITMSTHSDPQWRSFLLKA